MQKQNRVVVHSNNLGDKSDCRSFKILQLKCKALIRSNATLPDESGSKIVTGLEGSKAWFGNHASALISCCPFLGC